MTRPSATVALLLTFGVGVTTAQADPVRVPPRGPIQQSIARLQTEPEVLTSRQTSPAARTTWRRKVYTRLGISAGFLAGGYIGAKIEGDRCKCDDPGLAGFLIGAPIGMIVGGIIGHKLGS